MHGDRKSQSAVVNLGRKVAMVVTSAPVGLSFCPESTGRDMRCVVQVGLVLTRSSKVFQAVCLLFCQKLTLGRSDVQTVAILAVANQPTNQTTKQRQKERKEENKRKSYD